MKKTILLLALTICIAFSSSSFAQSSYKTSVGLGVDFGYGTTVGPSIKHFFNDNNAIQGDVLFGNDFATVGAYYQYHRSFKEAKQLKWYLGIGPEIFINDKGAGFAARPMAGLDYKIKEAPLSVTFDWRPIIVVDKYSSGFGAAQFDLGIRYTYR